MVTRGIEFDNTNPNTPFIRTFLIGKMYPTLTEFECGDFESSRFIQWFCEASRFWPVKSSQAEFDAYARQRLKDKVGYSRRQQDAFNIIDRYFDKGDLLTFDDIVAAVHFCAKQESCPHGVMYNGDTVIVDLPRQRKQKRDYMLKVDAVFWPTMEMLYPWQRIQDTVVKFVPVGATVREFDMVKLAFWFRYRNASRDERDNAMEFHSADYFDWTTANLYSRWREGLLAEKFANRVNPLPSDGGVVPTFDARNGKLVDGKLVGPTTPNNVNVWIPTSRSTRNVGMEPTDLAKMGGWAETKIF
jgi:hypothetical protein